jgi:glycerophosphoryl diester phosphodiesterase
MLRVLRPESGPDTTTALPAILHLKAEAGAFCLARPGWLRLVAIILLAPWAVGCAVPRHEVGLDKVLEQELGPSHREIPPYRCTIGAHRGSSVEYMENTLKALKAAEASSKYAFVEFDVQYSADSRIVVFHDQRLWRLFGSTRTIGNTTFADLQTFTRGEVCSYEEAMQVVHKRLNIEIKSQGDDEEDVRLADELIADLQARGRLKDVMISSISSEVIRYIGTKYPEVPTGKIRWLTRSTYLHFDALTESLYEELNEIQADYLMLHVSNLRNIERLLALKPADKTIVFWDFEDNIFLVHKDASDRLWGDSGFRNWCKRVRYGFLMPPQ